MKTLKVYTLVLKTCLIENEELVKASEMNEKESVHQPIVSADHVGLLLIMPQMIHVRGKNVRVAVDL